VLKTQICATRPQCVKWHGFCNTEPPINFFKITHFYFWFQYFGKRFNRWLQLLASSLFSVQMVIFLALVLYAPALAFHQGKLEKRAFDVPLRFITWRSARIAQWVK